MAWKQKLMRFKDLLNVLRGKEDRSQKLAMLFQPKDVRTASRFNANQVDFQTDVRTAKEFYPEFAPLETLAEHQGFVMISHQGIGREEAIKYEQATKATTESPFSIFQTFGKDGKKQKEKSESKE